MEMGGGNGKYDEIQEIMKPNLTLIVVLIETKRLLGWEGICKAMTAFCTPQKQFDYHHVFWIFNEKLLLIIDFSGNMK